MISLFHCREGEVQLVTLKDGLKKGTQHAKILWPASPFLILSTVIPCAKPYNENEVVPLHD